MLIGEISLQAEPRLPLFPIRVSSIPIDGGDIRVLRDDLLDGGTKQRALRPFLLETMKKGFEELAYGSPFAGYAQVALAYACADVGLTCKIFAEADPEKPGVAHDTTELARRAGAEIILAKSLEEAHQKAAAWAAKAPNRRELELGLDCEGYRWYLRTAVKQVLGTVLSNSGPAPRRVWVSLGSGTLSTALRSVLPSSIELCCIDVHVLPSDDDRIVRVGQLPGVRVYNAEELFAERCVTAPPIPSNRHYDAKVWKFIQAHAEPGDLWWNVAR